MFQESGSHKPSHYAQLPKKGRGTEAVYLLILGSPTHAGDSEWKPAPEDAQLGSLWQSHTECKKLIRSTQLESQLGTTLSISLPRSLASHHGTNEEILGKGNLMLISFSNPKRICENVLSSPLYK